MLAHLSQSCIQDLITPFTLMSLSSTPSEIYALIYVNMFLTHAITSAMLIMTHGDFRNWLSSMIKQQQRINLLWITAISFVDCIWELQIGSNRVQGLVKGDYAMLWNFLTSRAEARDVCLYTGEFEEEFDSNTFLKWLGKKFFLRLTFVFNFSCLTQPCFW